MLGERIAELRKKKGISQEELADALLTSRQAVSKWERGESDPDIDRLKDLAVYFDVSIDYLLDYDMETSSVNNFIERIKKCRETSIYDITKDEIRMIILKNSNNNNLILSIIIYLSDYYYIHHDKEIIDLVIQYTKKAILLFQPNNLYNVKLNDLHRVIASTYEIKGQYELAKDYIEKNQVIESDELIAQCELALGRYEEVEKITPEIFLKSIALILDSNSIQIRVLLRTKRVKEALDLADWSINFIKSVSKDEDNFINVVFIYSFIKAYCEKYLGLDYSKTLKYLRDNRDKTTNFKSVNDGLKFYNQNQFILASETASVKDDLYKELEEIKKNGVDDNQNVFDIFNEVYGD